MRQIINPSALKTQAYYNHAIVASGTPVFITGQVSWDVEGNVIGIGDIDAQVAKTYENIGHLLKELGATPADIVKTVTYATDRGFAPAIHRGRKLFFAQAALPASTFVVVQGLADPDLLVEIEAVVMVRD